VSHESPAAENLGEMKLKKVLLRFEPPGIGLEFEDDGKIDIRHINTPSSSSISCFKDIGPVIDSIIAEQSDLLTRKRHRALLQQMLCRLYQIEDTQPNDDDEADGGSPPGRKSEVGDPSPRVKESGTQGSKEPPMDSDMLIREGAQAVLVNLKNKLQVQNGEIVTVIKAPKGGKDKFEVAFPGTEGGMKVRSNELVLLAPGMPLSIGTHVVIRGLRNHLELNGSLGRIVESHEDTKRFEVRATESSQLFRVKQEHLVPIDPAWVAASAKENAHNAANTNTSNNINNVSSTPRVRKEEAAAPPQAAAGPGVDDVFEIGAIVELTGLKTAMSYNGMQAEVLAVDRSRSRYEIRLQDGAIKTIRSENVKLVSAGPNASKATPRRRKEGSSRGHG